MKLSEIYNQRVDVYEPSGVSSPTTVDPDKFPKTDDKKNRAKGERRRWKFKKNMRGAGSTGGVTMKGDSESLTGAENRSVVNGPWK